MSRPGEWLPAGSGLRLRRSSLHMPCKRPFLLISLALLSLACNFLLPGARGTATPQAATPVITPTERLVSATPEKTTAPTDVPVVIVETGNLSAGDDYAPELGNRGYDVRRYTLRVALRPEVEALEATARLELLSTQAGLTQVSLDFIGFDIDAVTVDGAAAAFDRTETKLLVSLPAPLDEGRAAALEVVYHGQPVREPSPYVPFIDHLGLQFRGDHVYVISEPDGARYWFPGNDHPRDKATYRFEILAPPGQTGVANGELVETETGGEGGDLFVWEHNFPMATYHATVAVGPYVRVDDTSPGGVPLRSYLFADDLPRFERYRAPIGQMVDWMAAQLGPYPFEAFGYVLVGGLGGALETQTMVVTDRDSLSETILAHELAHHWFGDWVSLHSWGEMWRSEGFATYLAEAWLQRDDPAGLAATFATAIEQGRKAPFPLRNPPPNMLFGGPIYQVGATLAAELRQTMGDEAFLLGLRDYFERYGGGTASDADFQAVMEAAAGQPLDAVFARWLE